MLDAVLTQPANKEGLLNASQSDEQKSEPVPLGWGERLGLVVGSFTGMTALFFPVTLNAVMMNQVAEVFAPVEENANSPYFKFWLGMSIALQLLMLLGKPDLRNEDFVEDDSDDQEVGFLKAVAVGREYPLAGFRLVFSSKFIATEKQQEEISHFVKCVFFMGGFLGLISGTFLNASSRVMVIIGIQNLLKNDEIDWQYISYAACFWGMLDEIFSKISEQTFDPKKLSPLSCSQPRNLFRLLTAGYFYPINALATPFRSTPAENEVEELKQTALTRPLRTSESLALSVGILRNMVNILFPIIVSSSVADQTATAMKLPNPGFKWAEIGLIFGITYELLKSWGTPRLKGVFKANASGSRLRQALASGTESPIGEIAASRGSANEEDEVQRIKKISCMGRFWVGLMGLMGATQGVYINAGGNAMSIHQFSDEAFGVPEQERLVFYIVMAWGFVDEILRILGGDTLSKEKLPPLHHWLHTGLELGALALQHPKIGFQWAWNGQEVLNKLHQEHLLDDVEDSTGAKIERSDNSGGSPISEPESPVMFISSSFRSINQNTEAKSAPSTPRSKSEQSVRIVLPENSPTADTGNLCPEKSPKTVVMHTQADKSLESPRGPGFFENNGVLPKNADSPTVLVSSSKKEPKDTMAQQAHCNMQ